MDSASVSVSHLLDRLWLESEVLDSLNFRQDSYAFPYRFFPGGNVQVWAPEPWKCIEGEVSRGYIDSEYGPASYEYDATKPLRCTIYPHMPSVLSDHLSVIKVTFRRIAGRRFLVANGIAIWGVGDKGAWFTTYDYRVVDDDVLIREGQRLLANMTPSLCKERLFRVYAANAEDLIRGRYKGRSSVIDSLFTEALRASRFYRVTNEKYVDACLN